MSCAISVLRIRNANLQFQKRNVCMRRCMLENLYHVQFVCRSINVLVNQVSLCQFSRLFWLDCLSQLPQQVGIVCPIDSLAFVKVVNEHNALCIPEDRDHHLPCWWHHLEGEKISVSNAWIAIWSLAWSGGPNTHLGWGSIQENWLDLFQRVPISPATWPAWCAFDQVSKAVAPTQQKPSTF